MKKIKKQTAVLVLGMHRSGTSAMTAGIQDVFGIKLSQSKHCPTEDNSKGYFEDFDIVDFNTRLLDFFEASWDSYNFGKERDFTDSGIAPFHDEALGILRENYGGDVLWGIKDPRISVLLPFWENVLHVLEANVSRVIALRHPLEVALSQKARLNSQSLDPSHRRCGSDLRYVLNLWYWYNLWLLKDLPDDNNIVVAFDSLLSDPTNEMQRMGRFLDITPNPDRLKEYGERFLEKQLKHHNINDAELDQYKKDFGYVFDLYDRLKAYATKDSFSKENARSVLKEMPNDKLLSSWASPIYAYFNTLKISSDTLNRSINTLKRSNDTLRMQLECLQKEQELIYRSCSWQITAPLRKMKSMIRKLKS